MGRRRAVAYDPNNFNRGKGRRRGKVSVDVDTTALTGSVVFYGSPTIPDGGYVITSDSNTKFGISTTTATPVFWTATDATLVSVVNGLPGNTTSITTTSDALEYLNDNDYYVISSTNQNIPTDGLVLELNPNSPASWPGTGDTLFDLSGNGNHAALSNSPTISGGFITWNGSNEFATIQFDSSMAGWATNQTIAMWIKHDYTSGRRNPWDQAYGGYGTWTHEQGNYINYYYGDSGANAQPYVGGNGSTTPRDKWNFVATTRNTSQRKWYKNSTLTNTQNHSFGTLETDTNVVRIARGYAGYWQGKMGPVLAYDKDLTQAEISSLYYGGPITTGSLILALDAGNLCSFDQGESVAYHLNPSEWNVNTTLSGSLVNGTSYSKEGGGSWLFDGTNDHIQMSSDIFTDNGSYTLSAWLKPNGSSWGNNAIPLYNTYSGNSSYGFWHHFGHDNVLRWRHGGTSYTTGDLSGIGLVADTWQLTTITWDRTTLRLYKNGQQVNSTTAPSDFRRAVTGARIGMLNYRRDSGDYNWNGHIALHHTYNRALSSEEVFQNYNAQKSRFV
jgi:hypothetical protein